MVDENELKVIEEISRQRDLTQRQLSAKTQLSLGAVNIIIKRLIKRGVVKTVNLTAKKLEYIITPKGFAAKAQKSYHYVEKTINLVKQVREEIGRIVMEEFNQGRKKFAVLGGDDLADIIELALKGFDYQRVSSVEEISDPQALILKGKNELKTNGRPVIEIAARLGQAYWEVELQPYERKRY
jgi:DNA-binding MarR family transcriptional regulator